jgi:gamma-butyrobetaine dioxygenase
MINLDLEGSIIGIRFTAASLAPQDLPEDLVEQAYLSVRAFAAEIYNPGLEFKYLMQAGDMHIFDNHRILHGRGEFEGSDSDRHLQHCSVPRDEFHNRLRIEAHQRDLIDEFLLMAEGALE